MCRAAQGGQLPLHCAAENGRSVEDILVVKLLLKANPKAVTTPDQARRCSHATAHPRMTEQSAI